MEAPEGCPQQVYAVMKDVGFELQEMQQILELKFSYFSVVGPRPDQQADICRCPSEFKRVPNPEPPVIRQERSNLGLAGSSEYLLHTIK